MLEELLEEIRGSKILILGVGNRLRGDDDVGPLLADRLRGEVQATVIDAGCVPENFIGPIIESNPDALLIIDAADIEASPGSISVIEDEAIRNTNLSTHSASLKLLLKVIHSEINPKVFIIGIQPESTHYGAPISFPIQATLDQLEAVFRRYLSELACQ